MRSTKIIKTIYRKLNINIFTYLFIALLFLIGYYKEFLIISSLLLIHEIGHFMMAKHFKWHIKEIAIYPYGGCVKFDEELNKPLKEELLIMLNGPLFQIIFFLFIFLLFKNNLITSRNFLLFKNYHYTLLFFNLLPVYPLDGGKLLNILLSYIIPFKKSNILTIIISTIILAILILISHNINFALTIGLLLIEIIIYFKRQNYLYNRLLLERYLKSLKFQKVKIINNKENIYKNKTHVIKYGKNYITEKDYLKKRYKGSEKC